MDRLEQIAADAASGVDGRLGVCILDLRNGHEYGVRLDEPLPMASVCKIPVLVALFRAVDAGTLDLGTRVRVDGTDHVGGSGLLSGMDAGIEPTVRDLMILMITISDNTATDLLFRLTPPASVTAAMRELGLTGIRVDRTIGELLDDIGAALHPALRGVHPHRWEDAAADHPEVKALLADPDANREAVNAAADRDTATPRDMARLCAKVVRGEAASAGSCEAMLGIMDMQLLNGRLPRDLPPTRFPHKTGSLGIGAVINDAGVLYVDQQPVAAIAALSRDVRDPAHQTSGQLARLGREVYDHFAGQTA